MTLLAGFQLKRVAVAAAALACLAGVAGAQTYPLTLPAGTSAQPQRGTSPPPRVAEPGPQYPANPLYPAFPVSVTWIPAILMSDGTVWANFGNGYVQVRTACRQPRVIDSRGTRTTTRRERSEMPCYSRNAQGSLVVTR